jgi:hypothetical protein
MAPETVIRMTHLKLLVKFVNKQESTNSASRCDFEDAVSLLEVVDSYQRVRSKVLDELAKLSLSSDLMRTITCWKSVLAKWNT